jgi:hypothetical protein
LKSTVASQFGIHTMNDIIKADEKKVHDEFVEK